MAKKAATKKPTGNKAGAKRTVKFNMKKVDFSFVKIAAKKAKKKEAEIKELFIEQLEYFNKKYPNWEHDKVENKARKRLRTNLRAQKIDNSSTYYVRKVYYPQPVDFGGLRWEKHMKAHKLNKRDALNRKLVKKVKNSKGRIEIVPIDDRAKLYGRDNPNYEQPLPQHSWQQTIGLVAIPKDDYDNNVEDSFSLPAIIKFKEDLADPTSDKFIGKYFDHEGFMQVTATRTRRPEKDPNDPTKQIWVENEDIIELKGDGNSIPIPVEDLNIDFPDISVEEIMNVYADYEVKVEEIDDYHEAMVEEQHETAEKAGKELNSTKCYKIIMMKGTVMSITLSDGKNNHKIIIDVPEDEDDDEDWEDWEEYDEDEEQQQQRTSVTVYFSKETPINFGKFSTILVFGTTNRGRMKDQISKQYTDSWFRTGMNGSGYQIIELEEPKVTEYTINDSDYESNGEVEVNPEDENGIEEDEELEEAEDSEDLEDEL
jgi:hypothetical protein